MLTEFNLDLSSNFQLDYYYYRLPNGNISEYKNEYGDKNIFYFPDIEKSDSSFIKLQTFYDDAKNERLNEHSPVYFILEEFDISKIEEKKIFDFISRLSYQQTINKAANQLKVMKIFFLRCALSEITNNFFAFTPNPRTKQNIRFKACEIKNIRVGLLSPENPSFSFEKCIIEKLEQIGVKKEFFTLKENIIKNLITSNHKIELTNIKINLYLHRNLDEIEIKTDNVEIKYNRKILAKLKISDYRGYWNTFSYLLNKVKSLNSERLDLDKYIAYFNSRDPKLNKFDSYFKKVLFSFHRGYTIILWPICTLIFLLLANFVITYYILGFKVDTLSTVFYPVDFFRKIIMKDFSFGNSPSGWKLVMFIFELGFLYSLYCFGFAVKKKYGFKVEKQI